MKPFLSRSFLISVFLFGCGKERGSQTDVSSTSKIRGIQNGQPLADSQYPAVVNVNGCTGTLIDPHWIISASHCLAWAQANPSSIPIQAGMETRHLVEIRLPDGWSQGVTETDIALGRLDSPILSITPLDLFEGRAALGVLDTIVGFGVNATDGAAKRLGMMENTGTGGRSIDGLPAVLSLKPGAVANNAPCSGDSGGAVLHMSQGIDKLAGVVVSVTYGESGKCGTVTQASAVSIAAHAPWIDDVISHPRPIYASPPPQCQLTMTPNRIQTTNSGLGFFYPKATIAASPGAVAASLVQLPSGNPYTDTLAGVLPGSYAFEAIVVDAESGQRGSCRSTVTIQYTPPTVPIQPVMPLPPTPPPIPNPIPAPRSVVPAPAEPLPPKPCPLPIANAGADRNIRAGQLVTLGAAPVAGVTYVWTASNGRRANTARLQAKPTTTTVFTLIARNACGASGSSVTVRVIPFVKPVRPRSAR